MGLKVIDATPTTISKFIRENCEHEWSYCYNADKPHKHCMKCSKFKYL